MFMPLAGARFHRLHQQVLTSRNLVGEQLVDCTVVEELKGTDMKALFVTLLGIWAILTVVGFALEGLLCSR